MCLCLPVDQLSAPDLGRLRSGLYVENIGEWERQLMVDFLRWITAQLITAACWFMQMWDAELLSKQAETFRDHGH